RDGRALLLAAESADAPPSIHRLDLPTRETAPLLPAEPREHEELVLPTLHTYAAEDGLVLSGWLFRPRAAFGPLPTLVWLHGGPEAQERPVFQPLFQALVMAGVAVFAPNVRGSAGYGRGFAAADDRERRFAAIPDVRASAEFLVRTGLADRDRLGVAGRSYGGYLTLVALAWFPELFRVGVDVCGMADLHTFYAGTEPWIASAAVTKYGDPVTDAELLRALSPIHRIDRVTAPLLVVHGANDTNVPLGEAEQVVAALRERGASPGFLLFEGEGHEVHDRANKAVFVHEVVGWVTAHLTGAGERSA
ncbi:MAG TPA: prolyl oligopeptidase family serine peptidase, partial [Pseudonocardia sp.]|nr:prolyl oligopeptidase family serine peptidase [Pseudonocardia sp.]